MEFNSVFKALRSMVRWIITVSFTGLLKIRIFLRKRHWIDRKLHYGVKHYARFQIESSLVKKITDLAYLNIVWAPLAPALRDLNGNEEFYCQQDGTPHIPIVTSGATWLNCQAGCTGWRGSVEYQPRSLDLTPLEFHLLMYVKDAAFLIKPTTRKALREDIEGSWAAIPVYTMLDFSIHSSAEFRSAWMLAVKIAKICPNSMCVKEPSVFNKPRPSLNHLRGILCTLNFYTFLAVLYIYSTNV